MPRISRRALLLMALWLIALGLALLVDRQIARAVAHDHPLLKGGHLAKILKLPGYFPFTLLVAGIVAVLHRRHLAAALPLVLSGPLVGISYILVKWCVGRHRPVIAIAPFTFHPFARGLRGLVGAEKGLSFPSGHAALAFATAICLAAALPRWAILFILFAAAVAGERVLENAHYLSDVVAGAGLGVCCGVLSLAILSSRHFPSGRPDTAAEIR